MKCNSGIMITLLAAKGEDETSVGANDRAVVSFLVFAVNCTTGMSLFQ